MGAELECYVHLPDQRPETIEAFWQPVHAAIISAGIPLLRIEQERGPGQFELVLGVASPVATIEYISTIKAMIEYQANFDKLLFSFDSTENAEHPASGMHIHVHLANAAGDNLMHKTDDEMSQMLAFAMGGLLGTIPLAMNVWCPAPESYARFADVDHVPRTLSWGVNNRYCALRIPMDNNDPYNKRIEHRMSGADANAAQVVEAMLAGLLVGLEYRIAPPAQEFGKPAPTDVRSWKYDLPEGAAERFAALLA